MSILGGTKIQTLMNFPKGIVLTSDFLKVNGFSAQLLAQYKRSQWLELIGDGAYKRRNEVVDWRGALAAIQGQLNIPIHCGARTALTLRGYGHYAELVPRDVYLFGCRGQKLPRWFSRYDWGLNFIYKMTGLFPDGLNESFSDFPVGEFSIRVSSPERAAMEMLYHVPSKQGFDEAERIIEALLTLRPPLVQSLLETCKSFKVKRLFMYMVETTNLPWVNELDLGKVNLGRGDRTVVKGGRLDPKYRITVPRSGGG
jgi:hypothetical protein